MVNLICSLESINSKFVIQGENQTVLEISQRNFSILKSLLARLDETTLKEDTALIFETEKRKIIAEAYEYFENNDIILSENVFEVINSTLDLLLHWLTKIYITWKSDKKSITLSSFTIPPSEEFPNSRNFVFTTENQKGNSDIYIMPPCFSGIYPSIFETYFEEKKIRIPNFEIVFEIYQSKKFYYLLLGADIANKVQTARYITINNLHEDPHKRVHIYRIRSAENMIHTIDLESYKTFHW